MIELIVAAVSFFVSVVAVIISYYSFKETHKTSIQPMVIFFHDPENKFYCAKNVGNGPALNVFIAGGESKEKPSSEVVLISAIEVGGVVRLEWVRSKLALIATYIDIDKHEYTTICENNLNSMSKKNKYSKNNDTDHWIPEWKLLIDEKTGRRSYPIKSIQMGREKMQLSKPKVQNSVS